MSRFWKTAVSNGMILFALGISLAAAVGHLFDYHPLTNWGDQTDMAINTAVCFILIAGALLLRTRRCGARPDTKHPRQL